MTTTTTGAPDHHPGYGRAGERRAFRSSVDRRFLKPCPGHLRFHGAPVWLVARRPARPAKAPALNGEGRRPPLHRKDARLGDHPRPRGPSRGGRGHSEGVAVRAPGRTAVLVITLAGHPGAG